MYVCMLVTLRNVNFHTLRMRISVSCVLRDHDIDHELRLGGEEHPHHIIYVCMREALLYTCISSNIPSKPAYGVYVSQLVRISHICDSYERLFTRHYLLTCRLVKQGFFSSN